MTQQGVLEHAVSFPIPHKWVASRLLLIKERPFLWSCDDDQPAESSDRKIKEPLDNSPVLEYCENAVVDNVENTKRPGQQHVIPFSVQISGRCAWRYTVHANHPTY